LARAGGRPGPTVRAPDAPMPPIRHKAVAPLPLPLPWVTGGWWVLWLVALPLPARCVPVLRDVLLGPQPPLPRWLPVT